MTLAAQLATVDPDELIERSGVSRSVVYRAIKDRRLPERGPNGAKLRAALDAMAAPGNGAAPIEDASMEAKRRLDMEHKRIQSQIAQLQLDEAAGLVVQRAAVESAHRHAAVEMRRGAEVLRREVRAVTPAKARSRVLAVVDAELVRLRERIARALVIDS